MTMDSPELPRRRLGRTDVSVTALGLGCAPLGGLFTPVDPAVAADAVAAAHAGGVRYFDTAPTTGPACPSGDSGALSPQWGVKASPSRPRWAAS
ncbi:hypothetical protein GCM10029992_11020 [Glycomyces albus]